MENLRVLILGKGSVGRAVFYYLKKLRATKKVAFFSNEKEIKNFDILIGALPSAWAQKGLKLALKYKKDLIDISTVAIPFYLKHKKEILKKGIRVIPGCGFSPGLVNLIAGFESQNFEKINNIEIAAGTLPENVNFFFPFTWCFEDLIEEHLEGFSGYKKEKLKEAGEFESYFIEEWNSLLYTLFKSKNISFRVIRPVGFSHFFQYLKNYGFFKKENIALTKKILTKEKKDNVTLALIKISGIRPRLRQGFGGQVKKKKEVVWKLLSEAKQTEKLNSMQKITALVPVIILGFISQDKIKNSGILFVEEIAKDKELFQEILAKLKKEGILIKKEELPA